MQSHIKLLRVIVALAAGTSGAPLVVGATQDDPAQAVQSVMDIPVEQAHLTPVSGLGIPMANTELKTYRGGFDLVKNDMQLSGSVANNVASNVMSGSNYITDGAFTNSTGFPTVIQNSGSNVLIQNATIVNLQMQ